MALFLFLASESRSKTSALSLRLILLLLCYSVQYLVYVRFQLLQLYYSTRFYWCFPLAVVARAKQKEKEKKEERNRTAGHTVMSPTQGKEKLLIPPPIPPSLPPHHPHPFAFEDCNVGLSYSSAYLTCTGGRQYPPDWASEILSHHRWQATLENQLQPSSARAMPSRRRRTCS